MKELFDAIHAQWSVVGLTLYNTEAPAKAVFPYAVTQIVSGQTNKFASGAHFSEEYLVQFNLFDDAPSMAVLMDAYAALVALFDFAALSITNFLSCVRESTMQTRVEGVWQVNVTYRVKWRVG